MRMTIAADFNLPVFSFAQSWRHQSHNEGTHRHEQNRG